jgi:HEAT repeat protein
MDNTLQQMLALLEKGSVEHRCAVLLVFGGLKFENAQILKAAGSLLGQPNPLLKDYALRYFEEVQPKAGIPPLLKLIEDPDKDLQERTIRLLSRCGPAAVASLLQNAPAASRLWQLNAARVLCAVRGKTALKGLLQMLLVGTDDFNKALCDLMTPAIRDMDAKEQQFLYDEIAAFAAKLDISKQRPAAISSIRLLGQLGRPHARRWLFRLLGPDHHPALRSHALVALLRCLRDQELRKEEYARLFSLLEEAEFSEITRLALELLDAHPVAEDFRAVLSRLLESRHEAVQKFALRKMGDFNTPATVRTLIEQLDDLDYRRRDIAARSLRKIPEARSALIKEFLTCDNPSKAWSIAELLPSYEGKWRRDALDALWRRLRAAVAAEDRIQASFMHVLKSAAAGFVYGQLAAHGASRIKAKKYKEALVFLSLLKDFSEFKPEQKFHLALAQFKANSHKVAPASYRQDPAVDLLGDLYRTSAFPLLETLKKEKNLTPEDFYYLGFRLVERPGEERSLGKDLLQYLAARSPRTKLGKIARNKLKLLAW